MMILSILIYAFQLTFLNTTHSTKTPIATVVNVKDHGARGDNKNDDTQAIINSIRYAKSNGIPTVYFPAGTYVIKQIGIKSGIIPLLDGVSLKGAGPSTCHIKLSGNRYNPNSIFYQAWWDEPVVSNVVIEGIDFDGNISQQKFDTEYQYCLGLSINNGKNIEIKNCKFQAFRGDGVLFGDTFLPSFNSRMVSNVRVHHNEFYNIYREGAMFCCVDGASFNNNYIHGSGYFVGGVDIERHSMNETVLNVTINDNIFDFRDGYGPYERKGPIVKYRRAVTIGFFYDGYKNKTADGLAGGHRVYNNKIYQGQIDCWGHTNIAIIHNTFNNVRENITGVRWLSAPAINVSDPASTKGLRDVTVSDNIINSTMLGNGILFNRYLDITAQNNTITGTGLDGINIYWSGGTIDNNVIKNAGTSLNKVAGIVINGTCPNLIVSNNTVIETRLGNKRNITHAIAIQSKNLAFARPQIYNNTAVNITNDVVSEFVGQPGFVDTKGNKQKKPVN